MRRPLAILSSSSFSKAKPQFDLPYNLCLIGPPGSGKGTYGRLLSLAWNQTPIYSVSDILRQQQQQQQQPQNSSDDNNNEIMNENSSSIITSNLNTGTLVDCEIVSQIVLSYLQIQDTPSNTCPVDVQNDRNFDSIESTHPKKQQQQYRTSYHHYKKFIMDGYPRTKRQIDIMIQTWPIKYHITHAIHLDIPNSVCEAKIVGRRYCTLCQGSPNIANVQTDDGFLLPPLIPNHCQVHLCHPKEHWIISRPDDNDMKIVKKRLLEYRQEEDALLKYYLSPNSNTNGSDHDDSNYCCCCIHVTPYHGIDDFPKMQQTIEAWLIRQEQQQMQQK